MTRSQTEAPVLMLMVFFGGFANLATEIIGPRLFASIFGSATSVWAVMISVTLVGLSVGYSLGGRIPPGQVRQRLPQILVGNAAWLLLVSWFVWNTPAARGTGLITISTTAMAAFFVPSTLFGMLTPMTITLLSEGRPPEQVSPIVGNVYALSTIGSVLGALTAAYIWIPWVGLSLSLRVFALVLVGFAAYFFQGQRRMAAGAAALVVLVFPQPDWVWADNDGLTLLAQREGYYQTVRVYTDEESFLQMHLGPTYHSRVDIDTGEPTFSYMQEIISMIEESERSVSGSHALVIGGAGHGLARWFENRGAQVTEVEIDPVVVELSDEYFGEIDGEVVIADGRVFVETADADAYDFVVVDAFDGGTGIPPQLISREFFASVGRVLKSDGLMLYNFIGSPEGDNAATYRAMSTTLRAVFEASGARTTRDDLTDRQNVIFAASPASVADLALTPLESGGFLMTDERNPIEILEERSREGYYFRR